MEVPDDDGDCSGDEWDGDSSPLPNPSIVIGERKAQVPWSDGIPVNGALQGEFVSAKTLINLRWMGYECHRSTKAAVYAFHSFLYDKDRRLSIFDFGARSAYGHRLQGLEDGVLFRQRILERTGEICEMSGWLNGKYVIGEDRPRKNDDILQGTVYNSHETIFVCGTSLITAKMALTLLRYKPVHALSEADAAKLLYLVQITPVYPNLIAYLQKPFVMQAIIMARHHSALYSDGALFLLMLRTLAAANLFPEASAFPITTFKDLFHTVWEEVQEHRKSPRWVLAQVIDEVDMSSLPQSFSNVMAIIGDDRDLLAKRLYGIFQPHDDDVGEYVRLLFQHDMNSKLDNDCLRRDRYYAQLVKGGMVNTNFGVVWTPNNENLHSAMDDQMYNKVMWKSLMGLADTWRTRGFMDHVSPALRRTVDERNQQQRGQNAQSSMTEAFLEFFRRWYGFSRDDNTPALPPAPVRPPIEDEEVDIMRNIREIKTAMEDVWSQARQYRISNEVHVVELEILQRLHRDGCLDWYDDARVTKFELSLIMRRESTLLTPFALAVAKNLFSERLVSNTRSNIMEHHRAAAWSERAYMHLVAFMRGEGETLVGNAIQNAKGNTRAGIPPDPNFKFLIHDYAHQYTSNPQLREAEHVHRKIAERGYGNVSRTDAMRDLQMYREVFGEPRRQTATDRLFADLANMFQNRPSTNGQGILHRLFDFASAPARDGAPPAPHPPGGVPV